MRFTLERVSGPSLEPVTLAEIRRQTRQFGDVTGDDADLNALVTAAREWAEDYTGRALVEQSWRLTIHGRAGIVPGGDTVRGFSGPGPVNYGFYSGFWRWARYGEIPLHKAPVIALTSFVTVDSAGAATAVDATTYELREANSKWPRLVALNGATWSTWLTSDMRIVYRAGFAAGLGSPDPTPDLSLVPEKFKSAIRLWVEANYDRDPKNMQLYLDAAANLLKSERSELSLA